MRRFFLHCILVTVAVATLAASRTHGEDKSFAVVVMDPLAAPLACDCVQGYAQRKYEKLGAYLQAKLNRPVKVYWGDSLPATMAEHSIAPSLVIGKHSVVKSDAKKAEVALQPLARLSALDGSVTQQGYFVVRRNDAAESVKDLTGYRILFGPEDCAEKNAAPVALLKASGVAVPSPLEISPACSTAASALMELEAGEKAAAVISSYAAPLLEGCGTIRKGDLRVIGQSKPVPFITAFINHELPDRLRQHVKTALLDVELNAELLVALESGIGFVEWKQKPDEGDQTGSTAAQQALKKKS